MIDADRANILFGELSLLNCSEGDPKGLVESIDKRNAGGSTTGY